MQDPFRMEYDFNKYLGLQPMSPIVLKCVVGFTYVLVGACIALVILGPILFIGLSGLSLEFQLSLILGGIVLAKVAFYINYSAGYRHTMAQLIETCVIIFPGLILLALKSFLAICGLPGLGDVLTYVFMVTAYYVWLNARNMDYYKFRGVCDEYAYSLIDKLFGAGVDVAVSKGVKEIGGYAFSYQGMTSVNIPDSVTNIGSCAFKNCTRLVEIAVPGSVIEIGQYAFQGCNNLVSVNINGVGRTRIGDFAFANSKKLESLTLDGVVHIGDNAFQGCDNLVSLVINGVGHTSIGSFAFSNSKKLESLTLDGVVHIGDNAFRESERLRFLTILGDLTNVGGCVFWGCNSLQEIIIPCYLNIDWAWKLSSQNKIRIVRMGGMLRPILPVHDVKKASNRNGNHMMVYYNKWISKLLMLIKHRLENEEVRDCLGIIIPPLPKEIWWCVLAHFIHILKEPATELLEIDNHYITRAEQLSNESQLAIQWAKEGAHACDVEHFRLLESIR